MISRRDPTRRRRKEIAKKLISIDRRSVFADIADKSRRRVCGEQIIDLVAHSYGIQFLRKHLIPVALITI